MIINVKKLVNYVSKMYYYGSDNNTFQKLKQQIFLKINQIGSKIVYQV